jgi:hypothetical protein
MATPDVAIPTEIRQVGNLLVVDLQTTTVEDPTATVLRIAAGQVADLLMVGEDRQEVVLRMTIPQAVTTAMRATVTRGAT